MSNRNSALLALFLFCAACIFGDAGLNLTGPGKRDYWTQRTDHPVRIEVMDTSGSLICRGQWSVGNTSPGYQKLTTNYHWPSSVTGLFLSIIIDGTYYVNYFAPTPICGSPVISYNLNNYYAGSSLRFNPSEGQTEIVTRWIINTGTGGFIEIEQVLLPVFKRLGEDTSGFARIQYTIYNNDIFTHNIGLTINQDVKIADNDWPNVLIGGRYTPTNQLFRAPVPSYWEASSATSCIPTTITARGILRGGDATPPDFFAIGNTMEHATRPRIAMTCIDSTIWNSWIGGPSGDIGFMAQWDPIAVPTDRQRRIVTYYGFSKCVPITDVLNVSVSFPEIGVDNCMVDTLVDVLTMISQDHPTASTIYHSRICLTVDSPVSVSSIVFPPTADSITWGMHRVSPTCFEFDSLVPDVIIPITWILHIPPTLSTTGFTGRAMFHGESPEVEVPDFDDTVSFTVPRFSGIGPMAALATGSDTMIYVNCTTFEVPVNYSDDEGLDPNWVIPSVRGISSVRYRRFGTPFTPLSGTFYLTPPSDSLFMMGTECFLIKLPPVKDIYGCPSSDTIRVNVCRDTIPPVVRNVVPAPASFLTTATPTIGFTVVDTGAGVKQDSIYFNYRIGGGSPINLTSTSPGVTITPFADSVRVRYPLTSVPSETSVTVCVTRVFDNIKICTPPNINEHDTCWTFYIDYTAPRVTVVTPPESIQYISCDTPNVCLRLVDRYGIDFSTSHLIVQANSTVYDTATGLHRDPSDSTIVCFRPGPYASGTLLTVTLLELWDIVGNSISSPVSWDWVIDTEGPVVTDLVPPSGSFVTGTLPLGRVFVYDSLAGLNFTGMTISMRKNAAAPRNLSTAEYSVISGHEIQLRPTDAFSYLDSVTFCITRLIDSALVCDPNNIDTPMCWFYRIDNRPPVADLVVPADDATIAMAGGAEVCVQFTDAVPMDTLSIVLTVNGSSPVMGTYSSATHQYCGPVPFDAIFTGMCSEAYVTIASARDSLGNAMTPVSFRYYVDIFPPELGFHFPLDGMILADDSVALEILDSCSFILEDTTAIEVKIRRGGATSYIDTIHGFEPCVSWGTAGYSLRDTAYMNLADCGVPLLSGDSIYICLIRASDTLSDATYGFNNFLGRTCFSYYYSRGGPEIAFRSPGFGSAISCHACTLAFTTFDSNSVDISTLQLQYSVNTGAPVTISYPHASLRFIPGATRTDFDTVHFVLPAAVSHGDSVTVTIIMLRDSLGVQIPMPRTTFFRVDWNAPAIGTVYPTPGSLIDVISPRIWARITDTPAGVNPTSAVFTLNGTPPPYPHDGTSVFWHADTLIFDLSITGIRIFDTTEVCIDLDDRATVCPPNHLRHCWNFALESGGPTVHPTAPTRNSVVSCNPMESIVMTITDSNGVDWSTLRLAASVPGGSTFNAIYGDPLLDVSGSTVRYTFPSAITEEGVVNITVEVSDSLGNVVGGGYYTYSFTVDHTPPFVSSRTPLCGTETTDIPHYIEAVVIDNFTWAVLSEFCVALEINSSGTIYRACGAPVVSVTGVTDFSIDIAALGATLVGGDTVRWWIESMNDYADSCGGNTSSSDTCMFWVNARGPEVALVSPTAGVDSVLRYGCGYPAHIGFLISDADGWATSSFRLISVCGATVDTFLIGDTEIAVVGDSVFWRPASGICPECDEVQVTIEVNDVLGNACSANYHRIVFDDTAPTFNVLSPTPGADVFVISPTYTFVFEDCSHPDTMSVGARFHWTSHPTETTLTNTGEEMRWSGDTLNIYTNIFDFRTADSVYICIDSVFDYVDACVNVNHIDSCFVVFIAQGGPSVEILHPFPDPTTHLYCANDTFIFLLSDIDGVNRDSLRMAVGHEEIFLGANLYWSSDSTLVYRPYEFPGRFDYTPGVISFWQVRDMLGYESDSIWFTFDFDIEGPLVVLTSPSMPTLPSGMPSINWNVHDILHAVEPESTFITIDGVRVDVDASRLFWFADGESLVYRADRIFFAFDTVEICVWAFDSTGCGYANRTIWCDTFDISSEGSPAVVLNSPAHDSCTIACTDSFVMSWQCIDPDGLRDVNTRVEFTDPAGSSTIFDGTSGRLEIVGDMLNFGIPATFVDGDVIHLRVDNVEDALGNPTSDIRTYVFYIDYAGPELTYSFPIASIADPTPPIRMLFSDVSGIDTLSPAVSVSVNGTLLGTYRYGDAELSWRADTLSIDGLRFAGGDTITVCVDSIADMPCMCGPNVSDSLCFVFTIPQGGPTASFILPEAGSIISCESPDIFIALCDSEGIVFDSLAFVISSGAVADTYSHDMNFAYVELDTVIGVCSHIRIDPIRNYADGDTVTVTLLAAIDTLFNPAMEESWYFVVDLSAPTADAMIPADGEIIYDWSQMVSVHVHDSISVVDATAFELTVLDNSIPMVTVDMTHASLSFDAVSETLRFDISQLALQWNEFHEYCIEITMRDTFDTMLCPANDTLIRWCFTVGDDDTTGPTITTLDSCFWRGDTFAAGFGDNFEVLIEDISGIYNDITDSSIFMIWDTTSCPDYSTGNYDGAALMLYDDIAGTARVIPGSLPAFIPEGTWLHYIIYANDNDFDFDNDLDRTLAISACDSCYFHDAKPPVYAAYNPQGDWFSSCTCGVQTITIAILDYDGLQLSLGTFEVNGIPYAFSDAAHISFSGALGAPFSSDTTFVHFHPDSGECYEHGETVNVRIWGISDYYFNVNDAETLTYHFTIDWVPPTVVYPEELDTNLYIEQFDTIRINLADDLAGVDPTSIIVQVKGKRLDHGHYPAAYDYEHEYTVGDGGIFYDDSLGLLTLVVLQLPGLSIENEDSVWVIIHDAADSTLSCEANRIPHSYSYPKFIVYEFECRSHPNPFSPNSDGANDIIYINYPKQVFNDAIVYIYDVQGIELRKITVGNAHTYTWDGLDSGGGACRPGVYIYAVEVDGKIICTGSLVLAR